MIKTITIGKKTLEIETIYPYQYEYGRGKEVLRIEISEEKHTFEEIYQLKGNQTSIHYFENKEEKNIYENYSADFVCHYQNGMYSVELTRISELEKKQLELQSNLDYVAMLLEINLEE